MWIAMGLGVVVALETLSPAVHAWLPQWWPVVAVPLFAAARVLKQHGFDQPVVSSKREGPKL